MRYLQTFEGFRKNDYLSGIALIVENEILLIWPRKYKEHDDMWSIPKGHIEDSEISKAKALKTIRKSDDDRWLNLSLASALKEMREETGFELDANFDYSFSVEYKKRTNKVLDVFVYNLTRNDLQQYLEEDILKPKNEIINAVRRGGEIKNISFFNFKDAFKRIESVQKKVLKEIMKRQGFSI